MSTQEHVNAMVKYIGVGLDLFAGCGEMTQEDFDKRLKAKAVPAEIKPMLFMFFTLGGFVEGTTLWSMTDKGFDPKTLPQNISSDSTKLMGSFIETGLGVFREAGSGAMTEVAFINRVNASQLVPEDIAGVLFGFLSATGYLKSEVRWVLAKKGWNAYEEGQRKKPLILSDALDRRATGGEMPRGSLAIREHGFHAPPQYAPPPRPLYPELPPPVQGTLLE